MTRTELCRKINDLMTAEGCSLTEDQDAVLAAALGAMWDEITGADQEPVAAQHRFRHPQKTTPDWSPWQPCEVSDRSSWEIDSRGYEVEYRALYTKEPK